VDLQRDVGMGAERPVDVVHAAFEYGEELE
jgi:hypothetical protein